MKTTRAIYIIIFCICLLLIAGMCIFEFTKTGTLSQRAIVSSIGIGLASVIFLAKGFLRTSGAKTDLRVYESENKKHIENAFTEPGREKHRQALLMGIDYFTTRQYKKGIKHLERLLKKCETTWDFCAVETFLALCYHRLGANNKAIEIYEDILRRDPRRSTVWSNLGNLYNDLGQSRKALDCLSKAIENDPENPYAYSNMSGAFMGVGAYDYAIPYAQKALEFKSNMYQASSNIAISLYAMGKYEDAEIYYKHAVKNGQDPSTLRRAMEICKDSFVPYDEDEESNEETAE